MQTGVTNALRAHRSELDDIKLKLTFIQNELAAYKDAYPEGLSESRLHSLNGLNEAAKAESRKS